MKALFEILSAVGIEVVPNRMRLKPGQTHARSTLNRILRQHGEGHLILVLRTIAESRGNESALTAPVINAVSDLILAHPEWADTGLKWIEAFDRIDIARMAEAAKANRNAVAPRAAIACMIYQQLASSVSFKRLRQ